MRTVIDSIPSLDVIYNNASIYWSGHDNRITDIAEEDWDRIIAVNLKSVFLFCKYGIPRLMKRGGAVINTASSAGVIGIPGCDAYTAAKGATVQCMRPASPMVRRKRDFFEWEFTKKMNAVGL